MAGLAVAFCYVDCLLLMLSITGKLSQGFNIKLFGELGSHASVFDLRDWHGISAVLNREALLAMSAALALLATLAELRRHSLLRV